MGVFAQGGDFSLEFCGQLQFGARAHLAPHQAIPQFTFAAVGLFQGMDE